MLGKRGGIIKIPPPTDGRKKFSDYMSFLSLLKCGASLEALLPMLSGRMYFAMAVTTPASLSRPWRKGGLRKLPPPTAGWMKFSSDMYFFLLSRGGHHSKPCQLCCSRRLHWLDIFFGCRFFCTGFHGGSVFFVYLMKGLDERSCFFKPTFVNLSLLMCSFDSSHRHNNNRFFSSYVCLVCFLC